MASKNRKLIIAIPILVALLGATLYEYGYLRVQSEINDLEDEAASKAKTLAKYKALIAQKPQIEESLAALKQARKTESAKTIEGQTPSIAAASLQNAVKGIITSRGGSITSERADKPEEAEKFRIITVTVEAVLPDTRALADTLYAIETQSPYLVVREMDTRIRAFKDPRDLSVKFRISGLMEGR